MSTTKPDDDGRTDVFFYSLPAAHSALFDTVYVSLLHVL